MKTQTQKLLIKKSPLFFLFAFISVILLIGGHYYFNYSAKQIRGDKENDLKAIAELKISQLVEWHKERTADAIVLSHSPFFIKEVEEWLKNKKDKTRTLDIKKRLFTPQKEYDYESIILSSIRGEILIEVGSDLGVFDTITAEKITEAVKSDKITFTDFYYSDNAEQIFFDIIAPLINKSNKTVGVLVFRRDPTKFIYPLIQRWPIPTKTAETLLLKKDGDSVLYLNELRHKKNTALKFRVPLTRKELSSVQAVLGKTRIIDATDYRGESVLAYASPVPETEWIMVAKIDKSEIFSDLYFSAIVVFGFVLLLIFLSGVGLILIYHSRQKNIYQELFLAERALKEKQEEFGVTLDSIGDAVISTDTNGRIKYMNQVAEELTGWKESEAINKDLTEVFKIINEETRSTVENPVEKVLSVGLIVGLANHTILISKDGTERPIADSGAPIKNEDGGIGGVVLVFRDQTVERKARKALEESELKLRNILENSTNVFFSHSPDHVITYFSPQVQNVLGYTQEEAMKKWTEFTSDNPINEEGFRLTEKAIETGEVQPLYELELVHKSGRKVWVEVREAPIVENGKTVQIVGALVDITERKLAEVELHKQRDTLQKIFDNIPVMIAYYDETGKFKMANQELIKKIGWTFEEWQTENILAKCYPDPDALKEALDFMIRKPIGWKDFKTTTKYGTVIDTTWTNIALPGGLSIGIGQDISERKRSEKALRESEYKYRSITENTNDMITLLDLSGNHIYCNQVYSDILGYNPADMIGLYAFEFVYPDDYYNAVSVFSEGIKSRLSSANITLRMVCKDGNIKWIDCRGKILYDQNNEPKSILVIGQDITERKRTEEALKESESIYRKLVEKMPDGIYKTTHDGKILDVNPAMVKILGYDSKEELLRVDIKKELYFDPEERERMTIEGKYNDLITYRLRKKDGTEVWVEDHGWYTFDDTGEILIHEGVIRDITDRKRAEDELKKSREELLEFFEDDISADLISTPEGKLVYCNKTYLNLFGFKSLEEAQNYPIDKLYLNPPDRKAFLERLQKEKKLELYEDDLILPDGRKIKTVENSTGIFDEEGNLIQIRSYLVDITKLKLAEEEAKKLLHAVEQSSAIIVITDLEGKIEYVNPKFTQVTGYTLDEVIGKNPNILKSGEKPVEEYKQLWDTITSGKEWRGDFHNKKKNGELYWESASISPIKDQNGKITHFLAVKEDITEKKSLESQFFRVQRLESIGTLAGGIAHDLNNVLAPILLSIEYLRKWIKDETGLQTLNTLETSAKRGADIIKQILTFARGVEGEKGTIQLKHLISEMKNIIKETFPKSIQTDIKIPNELWTIIGDATNLHQVLLNLCVNARDAMPDGGRLKITAENTDIDERFSKTHFNSKPGRYVVVTVSDTGTGIPKEIIDKIFDPFFTTKPTGQGTGLGLSTVHAIVKGHQGFINVYSEVNQGTTFKIYLPVAEIERTKVTEIKTSQLLTGNGELILVIDDEASICEITHQMLQLFGYRVLTALNGIDGLVIYKSKMEEIDLVITDMMMPKMDGYRVIRELRTINKEVKIIGSSGLVDGQDKGKNNLNSADAYIEKPYTAEKLLEVVYTVLHR